MWVRGRRQIYAVIQPTKGERNCDEEDFCGSFVNAQLDALKILLALNTINEIIKCCLILEVIFNLVPFRKKCVQSLSSHLFN